MEVIKSVSECKQTLAGAELLSIGFVPTMGNLHVGHRSLLERSKLENACTVLSIYINPTQFNNSADLETYPQTIEADLKLAEAAGVDYVFIPTYNELYPDDYTFQISEHGELSKVMEGKHRPGHFTGMLTVVMKLLLIAQPTRAYFGEKDYQQYLLVRAMAKAFLLGAEIIPMPTVRNEAGLPLSSRNSRLTKPQLEKAESFSLALADRTITCEEVEQRLISRGFAVDYIEAHFGRRFGAVWLDGIRLIDNIELGTS